MDENSSPHPASLIAPVIGERVTVTTDAGHTLEFTPVPLEGNEGRGPTRVWIEFRNGRIADLELSGPCEDVTVDADGKPVGSVQVWTARPVPPTETVYIGPGDEPRWDCIMPGQQLVLEGVVREEFKPEHDTCTPSCEPS